MNVPPSSLLCTSATVGSSGFDKTELRAWWDFAANGNDSHTTARDLTPINSPTFSGGAVDLESLSFQYFSSTDAGFNVTGAFTLCAFVNHESLADNRGVIARYAGAGNNRQYALYTTATGQIGAALSTSGNFEATNVLVTSSTVSTGVDIFLAVTFEPSTAIKIFVDGVKEAEKTTSVPSALYSSTAPLWVGCQFTVSDLNCFDGLIYWAAVFGRALSDSEISTLYSIGASGTYADL